MSISQTISTLPPAPSRTDPANFDARADAFVDAMEDMVPEVNTWAGQANDLATAVNMDAAAASVSATTASEAAAAAVAQGTAAAYNAGTSYALYDVALGSDGRAYRCLSAGLTGEDPVGSVTGNWMALNPDPLLAAALIAGTGVYPGWDMETQDTDGTNPPTDPAQPDQIVWSRGVERYKAALTWGTTGGEDGAVTVAVLSYSANSGTSYTSIDASDTFTITYSSDGEPVSAAWS